MHQRLSSPRAATPRSRPSSSRAPSAAASAAAQPGWACDDAASEASGVSAALGAARMSAALGSAQSGLERASATLAWIRDVRGQPVHPAQPVRSPGGPGGGGRTHPDWLQDPEVPAEQWGKERQMEREWREGRRPSPGGPGQGAEGEAGGWVDAGLRHLNEQQVQKRSHWTTVN